MCIGRDNLHRQVVHAFRFGGLLKLFFSGQIVVNSGKVNLARPVMIRVFNENDDRNRCPAPLSEHVVLFFLSLFAGGSGIAFQVPDVDGTEFLRHTLAHAVGGVGIQPSGVGDKTDDALFADAV